MSASGQRLPCTSGRFRLPFPPVTVGRWRKRGAPFSQLSVPLCNGPARRVRGYVTQSKTRTATSTTPGRATTTERKALATMGRRGGQKAAQRWKTDPQGEYAQGRRSALEAANKRRTIQGQGTRGRVLSIYSQTVFDTGSAPSARQIADEIGCERSTVAKHMSALRRAGLIEG